jgi:NAD(P)H dehydrogenase (quinone)
LTADGASARLVASAELRRAEGKPVPKVLVVYDSREGVVYAMAKAVAEGARSEGAEAVIEDVSAAEPRDLVKHDAVVVGSPCFLAGVTGKVKEFLDATWPLRGRLDGKAAAAFTSERHFGGGAEETLRAIHAAFLLHGMVIQGDVETGPFGVVALDPTGRREDVMAEEGDACRRLGARVARLAARLSGG